MAKINMIGKVFGRLTVLKQANNRYGELYYKCRCSCNGNESEYNGTRLRSGKTSSCGCFNKERIKEENTARNIRTHSKMIGRRFGRLIVLNPTILKNLHWHYMCQCDCGNTKEVDGSRLNLGRTQSCGCYGKEMLSKANTKHGMEGTRIYHIWVMMKDRCNSNNPNYGGKGVSYAVRWENFIEFYKDMGDPPTDKHTLDRIESNGHYTKRNCKWSTMKEQQNNRSNNHNIEYNGKIQSLAMWGEEVGIHRSTIRGRLKRGWSVEEALYGKD